MSHFVETMAHAGPSTWHGFSTFVGNDDVDSATMIHKAKLQDPIIKVPLQTEYGHYENPLGAGMEGEPRIVIPELLCDRNFGLVWCRPDNYDVIGRVGRYYHPFQNLELFKFMDELLGGNVKFHTAGALKGGSIVWALVKLNGDLNVRRIDGSDDVHQRYILIAHSHGGGVKGNTNLPIIIRQTDVRVQCWNTLSASLRSDKTATEYRIQHTASATKKVELAREAIGLALKEQEESLVLQQKLEDTLMTRPEMYDFALELVAEDVDLDEAKTRKRNRIEREVMELQGLFMMGSGNHGETRGDALNAVTEWVDHKRKAGRKAANAVEESATRLTNSWFGTGQNSGQAVKGRALRKLLR